MEPRAWALDGGHEWGWPPEALWCLVWCLSVHIHSLDTNDFQGGMSHTEVCPGADLLSSLFAEGTLGGVSLGISALGRKSLDWPRRQPSQQDQGNWLGQLSQRVVILVCPLPLAPRHPLLTEQALREVPSLFCTILVFLSGPVSCHCPPCSQPCQPSSNFLKTPG